METEFKIFEGEWLYSIEGAIKEYQEENNLEIKNMMLIKKGDVETIIGVLFEKRSENESR